MAETVTYGSAGGGGPTGDGRATSPISVAVAWIVVIIPAAWGITQTIKQSAQLFRKPPAQTMPAGNTQAPISAPTLGPAPTTTTAPTTGTTR